MKTWALGVALALIALAPAASAMKISEFRKFTQNEQAVYIGAAISMLAYTYAAEGDPRKARCIYDWYYGEAGTETPGPQAVAVELTIAEDDDPEKYEVEGILLGLTDEVCPAPSSAPPQPRR